MHEFTDSKGRTWKIELSIGAAKAVKKSLEIDMMEPKAFLTQVNDPMLMCDLLYLVCKEQVDERGMSDEQFGRGLGGDALWNAQNRFLEAYIDFFPNPEARENLRSLIAKMKTATMRLQKSIAGRMEKIDRKIEQEIDQAIAELETTLGEPSTNSPGSSE